MATIKIQTIKKQDYEIILDIYTRAYNAVGEEWNKEQIRDFLFYLLKREMKLKYLVDGKIIGGFISEIKPRYEGNFLFDPELFIDPDYQKQGYGTKLFKKTLVIAQKKYNAKTLVGFTFKNSFQLNWYKKLGIDIDSSRQMLYGKIKDIQ